MVPVEAQLSIWAPLSLVPTLSPSIGVTFRMLASDWFGEQGGWVLLPFCIGDRNLSAFHHFLYAQEPQFDMLHLAESLREDHRSSDLAVCAHFGPYVVAELVQKVFDEIVSTKPDPIA